MANPIVPFVDVLEGVQEVIAVLVVLKDGLLFIAARRDVIHRAGVFYAEGTGHERRISEETEKVKPQDLTLRVPAAGISGRHASEQVGDMNRNGWAAWAGIHKRSQDTCNS